MIERAKVLFFFVKMKFLVQKRRELQLLATFFHQKIKIGVNLQVTSM